MPEVPDIENYPLTSGIDKRAISTASQCMVDLCAQCGAKKRLAKLGSLLENLSDGIIVFDLDLNIIDTNKLGEYIHKHFKTFYYQGKNYTLQTLPFLQEAFINKTSLNKLTEIVGFDDYGIKHVFNLGSSPVFSEEAEVGGICLIISDITEIQKQARQLEDMVSALTHDLKTPLLAAETSLKCFLDGYFGEVSENQKQILSLLSQNNSDAIRLVKNLLSVFKYETKSYKLLLEPIELTVLLNRAINMIRPMIEEKEISLEASSENFQFVCDIFEVERVVVNLLTNAIKYTPPYGHIELQASRSKEGKVTITVQDNGVGIMDEDLPNLFERFWQSRKSGARANSTGLGLYLSRQIIEAHSGKIWAESKLGKGTKVTFELPEIIWDPSI